MAKSNSTLTKAKAHKKRACVAKHESQRKDELITHLKHKLDASKQQNAKLKQDNKDLRDEVAWGEYQANWLQCTTEKTMEAFADLTAKHNKSPNIIPEAKAKFKTFKKCLPDIINPATGVVDDPNILKTISFAFHCHVPPQDTDLPNEDPDIDIHDMTDIYEDEFPQKYLELCGFHPETTAPTGNEATVDQEITGQSKNPTPPGTPPRTTATEITPPGPPLDEILTLNANSRKKNNDNNNTDANSTEVSPITPPSQIVDDDGEHSCNCIIM